MWWIRVKVRRPTPEGGRAHDSADPQADHRKNQAMCRQVVAAAVVVVVVVAWTRGVYSGEVVVDEWTNLYTASNASVTRPVDDAVQGTKWVRYSTGGVWHNSLTHALPGWNFGVVLLFSIIYKLRIEKMVVCTVALQYLLVFGYIFKLERLDMKELFTFSMGKLCIKQYDFISLYNSNPWQMLWYLLLNVQT